MRNLSMKKEDGTKSAVTPKEEIYGKPAAVRVKNLRVKNIDDSPIATHIDLENGPPCRITGGEIGDGATIPLGRHELVTAKGFMDHGGDHFPSSRDWNMPDVKCSRKTCVANYSGKCTMPSLIEIGGKGCKGYHKRSSGEKK